MSMPQIPEESFRPTKEEVVIDLLKSIAMEENDCPFASCRSREDSSFCGSSSPHFG